MGKKEDTGGLLLRLILILLVLILLLKTSPMWGSEANDLTNSEFFPEEAVQTDSRDGTEKLEVYEGDDFAGALKHTFRDWFEPEEKDGK